MSGYYAYCVDTWGHVRGDPMPFVSPVPFLFQGTGYCLIVHIARLCKLSRLYCEICPNNHLACCILLSTLPRVSMICIETMTFFREKVKGY
jgi:hypothetical protein